MSRIRAILADGTARTFNRIVLEATDGRFTADIAAGKAPEEATWALLQAGQLEWANDPAGHILWRSASAPTSQIASHPTALTQPPAHTLDDNPEPIQESLTTVRCVFASGMSRPVDMAGAIRAGQPFGVDVGLLSAQGRAGVVRAVRSGVGVFIDSGAFRIFKSNLDLTRQQAAQLALMDGGGKGLDDDEVMKRYAGLVTVLGRIPSADLDKLYLVAPDVVGNAAETLRLVAKHRALLADMLNVGVNIIVPLQQDRRRGFVAMARAVLRSLAASNVGPILGIPTHECAIRARDLQDLLAQLRPARVHLLGAGASQSARQHLDTLRRQNEEIDVTMDANLLRSRLSELEGSAGEARSHKIAALLQLATAGKQEVSAQEFMADRPDAPGARSVGGGTRDSAEAARRVPQSAPSTSAAADEPPDPGPRARGATNRVRPRNLPRARR